MKQVEWCALSDIGPVRHNNEDVWGEVAECNFFALADGMGGHRAGEIAAREAINRLCKEVRRLHGSKGSFGEEDLSEIIQTTNRWVYELATRDPALKGMGTTLCCTHLYQDRLLYAHVGDSRIYQLREGRLVRLTKDHSLAEQLRRESSQKRPFPHKNIITRAVGTSRNVEPEVASLTIQPGDWYLLCSDGISDPVPDQEIEQILLHSRSAAEATETLLFEAMRRGGSDNSTALALRLPS